VANVAAVVNHRRELVLVDLDAGSARVVDRSSFGQLRGPAWSPDGRWLAYACSMSAQTTCIC
jgi:tricorn protease